MAENLARKSTSLDRCAILGVLLGSSLALLGLSLTSATPALAKEKSVYTTQEVAAGKRWRVRLRKVPKNTILSFALKSSGPIGLYIISARGAKLRTNRPPPLLALAFKNKIRFKVGIHEAGEYFIIFDNKAGKTARAIGFGVKIKTPGKGRKPAPRKMPDKMPSK